MSDIGINQVLAQMRAITNVATGSEQGAGGISGPGSSEFGKLLSESIAKVSGSQQHATELARSFEAGAPGVELPEVMVALQKASVSFQAMTQVRNKLLSAYQDIMNMQV